VNAGNEVSASVPGAATRLREGLFGFIQSGLMACLLSAFASGH
jgi:hypothetical protein